MKDDVLRVEGLSVSFPSDSDKMTVVDDVSFSLKKGKTLGIVGESGSGKTMTCLSIINLIPSYGGQINKGIITFKKDNSVLVDLLSLSELEMTTIRGRCIAMIFQEPTTSLNPNKQCGAQIEESLQVHSFCKRDSLNSRMLELLNEVGLEDPLRISKSYPHQISGGQLQRVLIAMAISCNPDILIADEPTTALDVTVQLEVINLIKRIVIEKEISCIFVSHDLGVIKEIADDVMVMRKGKVVEMDSIDNVFNNPKSPYTKGLLACRPPISKRLSRLPEVEDFLRPEPEKMQRKDEISQSKYYERLERIASSEVKLSIQGLHKSYTSGSFFSPSSHRIEAISSLDLEVKEGEIHGLVGESGCGKSTLAKCIVLLEKWDSGSILYNGQDITSYDRRGIKEFRKKVQIIFQDPFSSLNPRMKVGHAIVEPLMKYQSFGSHKHRVDHVIDIFEKVGLLPEYFDRYPHQFSGGERQRVSIARALAMKPEFLICDEPVSALDVSIQAQVLNLLVSLREELDLSMLFISHDLAVVKFMCDNVSIMSEGNIVEQGDVESIFSNPKNTYTKKLLNAIPASNYDF